jgi:hypothetical protein
MPRLRKASYVGSKPMRHLILNIVLLGVLACVLYYSFPTTDASRVWPILGFLTISICVLDILLAFWYKKSFKENLISALPLSFTLISAAFIVGYLMDLLIPLM